MSDTNLLFSSRSVRNISGYSTFIWIENNEHVGRGHSNLILSFRHIDFESLVMSGHLSVGDRWRIISLRFDQGASCTRIASILNCSLATVYNVIRLFHETNDVTEREGRGRTLLSRRRHRVTENLILYLMG